MFDLTQEPIDPQTARRALDSEAVGGFVSFEGLVRIQNLGREVLRLEYEASPALAANEFSKIEQEAREAFDILDLSCIHRSGILEIGEMAVWIGVTAAHRDPAFAACRFILDELKGRLPIWKKEHYADGISDWLEHP